MLKREVVQSLCLFPGNAFYRPQNMALAWTGFEGVTLAQGRPGRWRRLRE
jgi:hypothetical protein